MKNLNEAISTALNEVQKHSLDTITIKLSHEEEDYKDKKLFKSVFLDKEERHEQTKSQRIISKIVKIPVHKLKNIMLKKTLLHFISTLYEERYKQNSTTQIFSEFVLDQLLKRYSTPKLSETWFSHLLSSCIKYKSISRVRVFSRFLNIFNDFDSSDLSFYLDSYIYLTTSSVGTPLFSTESSETTMIPYSRCLDCIKSSQSSFPSIPNLQDQLKPLIKSDKKSSFIDLDDFLEKLVEAFSHSKQSAHHFLHLIYKASDLNEDGFLQYREFELIVRYLSVNIHSVSLCQDLFNQYSEKFLTDEKEDVKALSFVNLCLLDEENKVFRMEKVNEFVGGNGMERVIERLKEVEEEGLDTVLEEIRWRFIHNEIWEEHQKELLGLMEMIRHKIQGKENPEEVYLGLRLLQEDSKRCVVAENLNEMLPEICGAFCEFEEKLY